MPKKLHDKLKREAKKKFGKSPRADRYVYGTLSKIEKAKKRKGTKSARKKKRNA